MKPIQLTDKSRYLLGLSGLNILYALISSSFSYYLQFTVMIPAFTLGIILGVGKIFDAVKDPFLGFYISKSGWSSAKLLRRLPLPTAILTVLCFTQRLYSAQNSTAVNGAIMCWSFLVLILWETVFSFGDIPMVSYPRELTENPDERKNLLALRNIGSMVCSICCLVIQPLAFALSARLGGSARDERNAFFLVALLFSVPAFALYSLTVSRDRLKNERAGVEKRENQLYRYIFTNPVMRRVIASGILVSGYNLHAVVMPALITYYFASKNSGLTFLYTMLMGAGGFIGLFLSAIFVPSISKRFGNRRAFIFCSLLCAVPDIMIFLLYLDNRKTMTDLPVFLCMFTLLTVSGCFSSFASSIRTMIIDDAVRLEQEKSGLDLSAMFFSFVTSIVKVNNGIATLLSGLVHSLIGFSTAETARLNEYIAQGFIPRENDEYSLFFTALFFMFTVLPGISSLLSLFPFIKSDKTLLPKG